MRRYLQSGVQEIRMQVYLVVHQEGGERGRGADVRDQLPIRVGHNLDLLDLAKHVENDRRKTEPCAVWVE